MTRLAVSLFATLLLSACIGGDDPLGPNRRELETRTRTNNSYEYVRSQESWIGTGNDTTVRVANGVVVSRSYQAWERDPAGSPRTITASWTETGAKIGSHGEGDPASTLFQVYDECDDTVLGADRTKFDVTLAFANGGLLSTCVTVEKQCGDDCSRGIRLSSIAFAPRPE